MEHPPRSRASRRPAAVDRRAPTSPPPLWPSALVGLCALLVYLALNPGVAGDKDASEFVLVLAKLGSSHPTGYPMYTLLGHAFVAALHALGVGWDRAAGAWSAVGGALAMALLHALAARWLARQGVAAHVAAAFALLPVLIFGMNPLVTVETTLAEVNAFHLAWVAGTVLVVSALAHSLAAGEVPTLRRFALAGFLAGLGLAHHLTSVLVTVPLGVALLVLLYRARAPLAASLGATIAGALVPLASYAFIAWRAFHPGIVHWPSLDASWKSVWAHVTGADFGRYLGHFAPASEEAAAMRRSLWPWLWPLVFCAGVWGGRGRGEPGALRAGVLAAVALTIGYAFSYGVPDPATNFLPPLLLASAAAPAACAGLRPLRRHGHAVFAVLIVLALAQAGVWAGAARRRAALYRAFEQRVRSLWATVPFDTGFVMWMSDMVRLLHEYQILRGERPGVEAMHPVELTHDRPRQAFLRRHGFDPADPRRIGPGIAAERPASVEEMTRVVGIAVCREVNARSPLPVLLFMPEVPEARLLEKPAVAPADSLGSRSEAGAGAAEPP